MIKRIKFENYRIFKTLQVLDIKRLVVIFGKNNSGKSAVLKVPLLVHSSLNPKTEEVVEKSYLGVDIATNMRGLVYNRTHKSVMISVEGEDNVRLEYSFFVDESKSIKSKIESWYMENGKESYGYITGLDGSYLNTDTNDPERDLSFKGAAPKKDSSFDFFEHNVDNVDFNIDYIGPLRSETNAYIQLASLTEYSGVGGDNNYNYLIEDSLTTDKKLCTQVSKWYEDNFDGCSVSVNCDRAPIYSIELKHPLMDNHNIKDTGFGIRQSMPIVIRASRPCERPTLIVLEEPETHLHPAAHGNMAELITQSTLDDKNKYYLIETHSINFIMRLRRLIAEGILSNNDVALYYVKYDNNDSSSRLKEIKINERGYVDYWPEGIFEETLDEAIAIKRAQIE